MALWAPGSEGPGLLAPVPVGPTRTRAVLRCLLPILSREALRASGPAPPPFLGAPPGEQRPGPQRVGAGFPQAAGALLSWPRGRRGGQMEGPRLGVPRSQERVSRGGEMARQPVPPVFLRSGHRALPFSSGRSQEGCPGHPVPAQGCRICRRWGHCGGCGPCCPPAPRPAADSPLHQLPAARRASLRVSAARH
uniref:Uncharacterized protein n=1 Tax=Myotis myotis TaxID=51298 RepID=A0A7J7T5L7_MYOMY|nr:hypothetical protein mMyoMyo1_009120 [Myotis myotis]